MRIFPELAATSEVPVKIGFWQRQFRQAPTRPQLVFDLIFGVVGPILCFVFDPVVFQGGILGRPLFPDYQAFVYLLSGMEIVVLCLWLVLGAGSELANAMIGGALMVGGVFCFAIGLLLLPFSVMGLMVAIGILGFTPFMAALVYLRNGWRALRSPAKQPSVFTRATGGACGLLLVAGIPLALSMQIRSAVLKSVDYIIRADPVHAPQAAQQLAVLKYFASSDIERIPQAYLSERDESRKQLMRSYYREITGEDLEDRIRILQD